MNTERIKRSILSLSRRAATTEDHAAKGILNTLVRMLKEDFPDKEAKTFDIPETDKSEQKVMKVPDKKPVDIDALDLRTNTYFDIPDAK